MEQANENAEAKNNSNGNGGMSTDTGLPLANIDPRRLPSGTLDHNIQVLVTQEVMLHNAVMVREQARVLQKVVGEDPQTSAMKTELGRLGEQRYRLVKEKNERMLDLDRQRAARFGLTIYDVENMSVSPDATIEEEDDTDDE